MERRSDQTWRSERRNCIRCNAVFGPSEKKDKTSWGKQKFCTRTCSGKSAPRTPLMDDADKFWPRVDKTPGQGPNGDCWIWTGGKAHYGHGQFSNGPRKIYAHRYSYKIHNGDPEGLDVCHRCDNPPCVNPDHLFLGTHRDNMEDMKDKKRTAWGVLATSAKLSEDDVRAIRKDPRIGKVIAEQYAVHHSTVYDIKARKKWKNLPD